MPLLNPSVVVGVSYLAASLALLARQVIHLAGTKATAAKVIGGLSTATSLAQACILFQESGSALMSTPRGVCILLNAVLVSPLLRPQYTLQEPSTSSI